jgi:hypothetical protein
MARRVRAAAARGNVYFTSSGGIMKSTSASADLQPSGLPQCLDLVLTLTNSSPTLMATAYQAAYRAVLCLKDANNNLIQGAPSGRFTVSNTTGGTRDVQCVIYLPPQITTSHFVQLYRTTIVSTSTDPGDDQRLVLEYFPTSTDITNGYVTLADITPDAFRGADLYTNANATDGGQANQNDEPPLGRDLAWFQNKLCVANYTDKHEMALQMLGTSGMTTQTITLAGVTYTAGTSETVSTGTFIVYKSGGGGYTDLGTQSLNVEGTAKSLCKVINQYAANTSVYAFYDSGFDDPPGRIRIVERAVGGSQFTVICSASAMGNSFSPAIPTSGSTYASVADRRVNQIRVSKDGEPEHMPRYRNIIVGGEDEEIQRIIPLRSSLIVIKDRSVWRLSSVEPGDAEPVFLDNTCQISGRDSAAVLNNTVFMLSDQGFVAVTDNGIQIVGRPTENRVLAGLEKANAPDHDRFVGIGHEQRRIYICVAYDAAAGENTCYVYSPIANQGRGAWTKRRINAVAFAVLSNRLLYALNNANGHVLRQRASRRDGASWYRDYVEDSSTFTITSIDTSAGTCTGTWSGYVDFDSYESDIGYGWKLYDGSNQYLILSSASASTVLTLNTTTGLTTGAKTVYRPIPWTVEYNPIAGNQNMKQFGDVVVKAETMNAYAIDFAHANQNDTKSDPASDDWSAQPSADRVYVPKASGAEASSTSNDFGATATTNPFNPFNEIRSTVHPERAMGQQLSIRLSGGVAEGYVGIKAVTVEAEDLETTKGRQ